MHIGQLKNGLARHRALLFKTLADARSLSCKMLRGEHLSKAHSAVSVATVASVCSLLMLLDPICSSDSQRPKVP